MISGRKTPTHSSRVSVIDDSDDEGTGISTTISVDSFLSFNNINPLHQREILPINPLNPSGLSNSVLVDRDDPVGAETIGIGIGIGIGIVIGIVIGIWGFVE